jgi:hypothetical protein
MQPDLKDLQISTRELERITGFEISELFIGSIFGGVYRPGLWQSPHRLIAFGLTQVWVGFLSFIFALPLGLMVIRNSTRAIADLPSMLQVLYLPFGVSVMILILWNTYMRFRVKRFQPLAHLLDDVDKYNQVLQAVNVLDQLQALSTSPQQMFHREQTLEALGVSRSSLICGLMTEKILRDSRGLLTRRQELFTLIEQNLAALRAFEMTTQADEYARLLNSALEIGTSVYQEIQKI